jgi:hypothetical protein
LNATFQQNTHHFSVTIHSDEYVTEWQNTAFFFLLKNVQNQNSCKNSAQEMPIMSSLLKNKGSDQQMIFFCETTFFCEFTVTDSPTKCGNLENLFQKAHITGIAQK